MGSALPAIHFEGRRASSRAQVGRVVRQVLNVEFRGFVQTQQQHIFANLIGRPQQRTKTLTPDLQVELHASVGDQRAILVDDGDRMEY